MTQGKYPLISSREELKTATIKGNKYIKRKLGSQKYKQLKEVERRFATGDDSAKKFTRDGEVIKPTRKKLHDNIIRTQFRSKKSIDRKDPDLYLLGGLPASGKSTVLAKKIPEKTIVIDSDGYKKKLSRNSRSPVPGFPLIHAGLLHEEAEILVNRAEKKAIKEKRDVTYDATMKNYEKGKKIIRRFKKAGYDVHYLSTQKKPHQTIPHAAKRFISKGRYVPLGYIKESGNKISRNSWRIRKKADTFQIHDVTNFPKTKLIKKSKKDMSHNFRDPLTL